MNKRYILFALPALLAATLTHPAMAKDKKPGSAPPPPPATKGGPGVKTASKESKVSGMVKGAPKGKTFTVARKGGTVEVDATNAKIRANGKFAGMDVIKGGTQVNVTGAMDGKVLKATDVDAHPRAAKGDAKKGDAKKPDAKKTGAKKAEPKK